ncbi:MAG: spore cortex biosynthesis protein YabQ [Lachnospiraceae bacterium]|nr:spore cortex biosynthesis protein YabQ [Lachnospiraceae bacterium]
MSSVIRQETAVFLIFILHGATLTLLYDVLRALRRCFRHSLVILSIEDFLFWLLAGFLTFYLAFRKSDGIIRGYAAAGILIGFLLYHFMFSHLVVEGLSRLLGLVLRAVAFVREIIWTVLHSMLRYLRMVLSFTRHILRTVFRFMQCILRTAACFLKHGLRILWKPMRRILSIPVRKTCEFCKKKNFFKKTCRFHKKRIEFTRKNDYNKKNCAGTKQLRKNQGA